MLKKRREERTNRTDQRTADMIPKRRVRRRAAVSQTAKTPVPSPRCCQPDLKGQTTAQSPFEPHVCLSTLFSCEGAFRPGVPFPHCIFPVLWPVPNATPERPLPRSGCWGQGWLSDRFLPSPHPSPRFHPVSALSGPRVGESPSGRTAARPSPSRSSACQMLSQIIHLFSGNESGERERPPLTRGSRG